MSTQKPTKFRGCFFFPAFAENKEGKKKKKRTSLGTSEASLHGGSFNSQLRAAQDRKKNILFADVYTRQCFLPIVSGALQEATSYTELLKGHELCSFKMNVSSLEHHLMISGNGGWKYL